MGYAFISYSTKNQTSADAMREIFKKNNIDTWMAPYDIPAGSKYAAMITKAIRECSCFVLLLSNDSQASEAVDSEVEMATLSFKKPIITVELESVVLNDAFFFYIHNKQMIAAHKIEEKSDEIKQVVEAVGAYTKNKNTETAVEKKEKHFAYKYLVEWVKNHGKEDGGSFSYEINNQCYLSFLRNELSVNYCDNVPVESGDEVFKGYYIGSLNLETFYFCFCCGDACVDGYLYAQDYTLNSLFKYDYEGFEDEEESMVELAKQTIDWCLTSLHHFLLSKRLPISMADLGFEAYFQN